MLKKRSEGLDPAPFCRDSIVLLFCGNVCDNYRILLRRRNVENVYFDSKIQQILTYLPDISLVTSWSVMETQKIEKL